MNFRIITLCFLSGLLGVPSFAAEPCNLTCYCSEELPCTWISMDQLCLGGLFCQKHSETECTDDLKGQITPGTCVDDGVGTRLALKEKRP